MAYDTWGFPTMANMSCETITHNGAVRFRRKRFSRTLVLRRFKVSGEYHSHLEAVQAQSVFDAAKGKAEVISITVPDSGTITARFAEDSFSIVYFSPKHARISFELIEEPRPYA